MAAGGTLTIQLYCDTPRPDSVCDHNCSLAKFDLPYDVEVRDGPVWFTGQNDDGDPTFYAAAPGTGTVAFVNPADRSVYAEVATHAVALDRIVLERTKTEREPDDLEIVLATEHQGPAFTVDLLGAANEHLVDSSLAMQLPPNAERTSVDAFNLHGLSSGSYVLGFEAGHTMFSESVVIVNEADSLEVWSAPTTIPRTLVPGELEYVCFLAKSAGRYITGLWWEHTVDGEKKGGLYSHGCVLALTNQPSGSPVTFTAVAGGQSMTIEIPAR